MNNSDNLLNWMDEEDSKYPAVADQDNNNNNMMPDDDEDVLAPRDTSSSGGPPLEDTAMQVLLDSLQQRLHSSIQTHQDCATKTFEQASLFLQESALISSQHFGPVYQSEMQEAHRLDEIAPAVDSATVHHLALGGDDNDDMTGGSGGAAGIVQHG
jgi:hypothetical protein